MENLLLLAVNVWLMGLVVVVLHAISPKYGYAPLLLVLGAMMAVLQGQVNLFVQPMDGLDLFVSSTLFVPAIVMGILILYIANGTMPTRLTIFAVLGGAVLVLYARTMFRLIYDLPDSGTYGGIQIAVIRLRTSIASVAAYAADLFVIAVLYQGMKNHFRLPAWLTIGLAMIGTLWTDAIVFNLISDFGRADFLRSFPGDVVAKTLAAVLMWPIAAIYLVRYAPRQPGYQGHVPRRTLDLLYGDYERITQALSRTQQQLEESRAAHRQETAYFRQFMENVEEAFWMQTPGDDAPFYVNPAFERIWGFRKHEFFSNPHAWENALYYEDRPRVLQFVHEHRHEAYQLDYRIVHQSSREVRWVRERTFPIRNDAGAVYRVAGIAEDITSRKEVEKAHLDLELEREKVKFMRQFIGEVTHDLRTPLAALDLRIYLMQHTANPEKQRLHLDELAKITGRMGQLIEDLMTLTRLENISTLTLTLVNMGTMLQSLLAHVAPIAERKQIQIVFTPPDPPIWLHADDKDLERALGNLINNAVHYTPERGQVEVNLSNHGGEVAITVRDTGIGIPADELPHVFERFYRATNAKVVDPGGTGLGLAIVQRVIQQHGGKVLVESTVGQGTAFHITLPVRKD